jgi:hypothetical protein
MEKPIIPVIVMVILIAYIGLLTPLTSAQAGEVRLTLDLEPKDCGRVYAEPPGENYTYRPGTMVQIYAEQAEGCKFAYWVSDLAGLNGSLNNPVTVTLFSDAYFKAVFVRVGAPKPGGEVTQPKTHAFLRVTANVSKFQEEVRLVPIGEEVTVSVPRDIYLNDTARYVFVGWDGYESKEPLIRVLVRGDTTVKALYTLYVRFMELWYHYSDFIVFYAPIVELSPEERLRPVHLTLKPMNITLPVGSSIPREFSDRVEVKYQKEYLLTIRSLAPETIPVMVNGEAVSLGSYIERWIQEGLKVDVRVLVDETERGWIREPKQLSLIMSSPVSIVVEYEEKPYSWALDSPLKPVLYPILETIARSYKGTGMWPQISQIVSQPMLVYAMVFGFPTGLAGIGYAGYKLISRVGVGGLKVSRARRVIEERIRKARPEEIISAISSGTPSSGMGREEIRLPDNMPFPEWLHLEAAESMEEYEPARLEEKAEPEVIEPVEKLEREERVEEEFRRIDIMEEISRGGGMRADELVEALVDRLDEEVLEKLREAVLSGRFKVTAVENTVWSPAMVRRVSRVLDEKGAVAVEGADPYVRKKVAEWVGAIEREVTGKPYMHLEDAYERDVDSVAARIGDACLVILGEAVRPDVTKAYSYAVRLLGRKLIKLGGGPLPAVRLENPSRSELAAYMAAKAALTGLIDRIGMKDVAEVSMIASRSRGYETVDYYLELLSGGPIDLDTFRKKESDKLFDGHEKIAVDMWRRTGSVSEAVAHLGNILAQIDPAKAETRLRIFKEKLLKTAGYMEAGSQQENPVGKKIVENVKGDAQPLEAVKTKLAERYTSIMRNVRDEEVRRRLANQLETIRGRRHGEKR